MNGSVMNDGKESMYDRRPIITCAGELDVFSTLEERISGALPQEPGELRRALGRPTRLVKIGSTFIPFAPTALPPKSHQWDAIRRPLFHIYWTECTDMDVYKTTVKDEIDQWIRQLTTKDIPDFMIIVVENYDGKRPNKLLPRTTVMDKIRTDFLPKNGDRCISVLTTPSSVTRTNDSFRTLIIQLRHLLLVAYGRALNRFEEYVRQQREHRHDLDWHLLDYFDLQQELASILEMLGLYDEALIQYDELDVVVGQCLIGAGNLTENKWLNRVRLVMDRWQGLRLNGEQMEKWQNTQEPTLLELRTYLFGRQARMLLAMNKVWEMAARCLPFLHNTKHELYILDILQPNGSFACWSFLITMEILGVTDLHNNSDTVELYSLHTAPLYAYASKKLYELGDICGLLPDVHTPTSAQLHLVVGLSAGIGDDEREGSPSVRLKQALCSPDVFRRTYLDLAESAMCTYKHIGRLRSARMVGREMALFYALANDRQKTVAFLNDVLRTFEQDGWTELMAQTQIELVDCYRHLLDLKSTDSVCKYVRTVASIATASEIDTLIRWTYFDELIKFITDLNDDLYLSSDGLIKLDKILINSKKIMQFNHIELELHLDNAFPREIICDHIMIGLELINDGLEKKFIDKRIISNDKSSKCLMKRLKIVRHLDYKQDKQLASASVVCQTKTKDDKRKGSGLTNEMTAKFDDYIEMGEPTILTPGINTFFLKKPMEKPGKYHLTNLILNFKHLYLIGRTFDQSALGFDVREEAPSVHLYKTKAPLMAGIEQKMNLIITMGTFMINSKSKIKLICSQGLQFRTNYTIPYVTTMELEIGEMIALSSRRIHLYVLADMLMKDHSITIGCDWLLTHTPPIVVNLSFTSVLSCRWRLHTANERKFVHITLNAHDCDRLLLKNARLNATNADIINCNSVKSSNEIEPNRTIGFLWELIPKVGNDGISSKCEFLVDFDLATPRVAPSNEMKTYKYYFELNNYQTLYVIDADVEPMKGNEFLRVGIVCNLQLAIEMIKWPDEAVGRPDALVDNVANTTSIMYEVLAEQSVWAVCGRTAGVICFDPTNRSQSVLLDVMPLSGGFLPLPNVRISRYIMADSAISDKAGSKIDTHPRLEPFAPGQVYNSSKGKQVHVIINTNENS